MSTSSKITDNRFGRYPVHGYRPNLFCFHSFTIIVKHLPINNKFGLLAVGDPRLSKGELVRVGGSVGVLFSYSFSPSPKRAASKSLRQ